MTTRSRSTRLEPAALGDAPDPAARTGELCAALIAEAEANPKLAGPVYLQAALRSPAAKEAPKTTQLVRVPHRMRRSEDTTTCLVVCDPQGKWDRLLQDSETRMLFDEVIGVGRLRRRLGGSRRRRNEFDSSFSHIFVQDRAVRPLAETLGAAYCKRAQTMPIEIILEDPTLVGRQVRAALRAAQLTLRPVPAVTVRVGDTRMSAHKLAANVAAVAAEVRARYGGGRMYIKTPESASLGLPE